LATPPSWPTGTTSEETFCRNDIALGGRMVVRYFHRTVVLPDHPSVVFDTDTSIYTGSCPGEVFGESAPGNGVFVNTGSTRYPTVMPSTGVGLRLGRLTAVVDTSQELDILIVYVRAPGRSMPIEIQIGLAGDGVLARTILHSLRPNRGDHGPRSS